MSESTLEVDTEAAADAFGVLSDDSRVDILLALWDAEQSSFEDLRRAAGIDDSGRFNYHLDQLVDRFVRKTDDGYRLTSLGANVVDLLLDARFGLSPSPIDEPTNADCPACGERLHVYYEDGDMRLACPSCETVVHYGFFPPRGRATRTAEETIDAYSRQVWRDVTLAHRGVCPHCSGRMETRIEVDPDWAIDVAARGRCRDCGAPYSFPIGLHLLAEPAVVSFLADHGTFIDERRFWELDFVYGDAVSVVSESPPRYQVTITAGAERLEVTLDEQCVVVDIARHVPH